MILADEIQVNDPTPELVQFLIANPCEFCSRGEEAKFFLNHGWVHLDITEWSRCSIIPVLVDNGILKN